MEGNILVDGVLASCYAGFDHDAEHIAVTPLLWFPTIMDFFLGAEKSTHAYLKILQHMGAVTVPSWQKLM